MPYPNSNVLNIVIPQTSASMDGLQSPFVERIISGSRLVLQTDTTGTLIGSSDLNVNNITASNISASNTISASNLWVQNSIVDSGTLTVLGNTILGDATSDIIRITGSTSLSGSFSVVGASTFNGLVSASAGLTASAIQDAGTLTVLGSSTLGNTFVTNLTASNISASNTLSASNVWFNNSMVYTETMTTGSLTLPDISFTSTATTSSDVMMRIDTTVLTGSAVALQINASGSQASYAISASNGIIAGTNYIATNITASNISASGTIIATDISASNEMLIGSGPIYRTWTERNLNQDHTKLYVSGSATLFGNYATLTLATSASDAGAQSNIIFSRLGAYSPPGDTTPVLLGRMSLGIDSGSNDLRVFGYYASTDPENNAFSNINAGTRVIFKQNGYFGIGSFISYGQYGGSVIDYKSSLPGYAGQNYVGPDALLTLLPADSGSVGTPFSRFANRNILNIMSYDTSSIMFISGSDGYVLLGKNTTDGINRLQVAGNVSASAYTGSSANFTSLTATNLTSSNISASGNISSSTLVVTGAATFGSVVINNLTSSNISASGNISSSTLYVTNNGTINGNLNVNGNSILGDVLTDTTTISGSLKVLNANNAISYTDTNAALQVDGGARISKDTWISGSLNVAGDLTIFGSSSVVYISSSTVIINDNIIQLNAYFPYERYAGFEVFDSGSNQRSASLLWDGQNDNWTTVDQNNSASNIIIGPTASFGSPIQGLTVNRLTKAYEGNAISDSALSDDGTTLVYSGTTISSSRITAVTGSITYITGALVTYVTGSFTTMTITTGSSPGVGSQVPSSPTAVGMPGQINVDNNFVYVYTNNIWKRVPLSTWSL